MRIRKNLRKVPQGRTVILWVWVPHITDAVLLIADRDGRDGDWRAARSTGSTAKDIGMTMSGDRSHHSEDMRSLDLSLPLRCKTHIVASGRASCSSGRLFTPKGCTVDIKLFGRDPGSPAKQFCHWHASNSSNEHVGVQGNSAEWVHVRRVNRVMLVCCWRHSIQTIGAESKTSYRRVSRPSYSEIRPPPSPPSARILASPKGFLAK